MIITTQTLYSIYYVPIELVVPQKSWIDQLTPIDIKITILLSYYYTIRIHVFELPHSRNRCAFYIREGISLLPLSGGSLQHNIIYNCTNIDANTMIIISERRLSQLSNNRTTDRRNGSFIIISIVICESASIVILQAYYTNAGRHNPRSETVCVRVILC